MHALRLAQNLQELGHTVEGVTRFTDRAYNPSTFYTETELTRDYETEGVPVHVVGLSRWDLNRLRVLRRLWWKPSRFVWARRLVCWVMVPKLTRLFCERQYDLIHFDGSGHELWGYAALKAARKLGLPFVVQPSVHIGEWGVSSGDYDLFRQADALVVHSQAEKDHLMTDGDLPESLIQVVYNGIDDTRGGDAEAFRSKYDVAGPMVLFIGRKSVDKGYFLLHRAFRDVVAQFPDARLVMLGPTRTDFREDVDDDVPWQIEINDATEEEKRDALAACDVFCMPSRGESFGLGYMEAGLCGTPSIARDLPVLEDLLGRHGAAVLVGSRNEDGQVDVEEQEIAAAMIKLLQEDDLRGRMGQKAREQAETYLWPQIVHRFAAVYENVC